MRSKLTPTLTSNAAAGASALVPQPLLLMASLARDIQALRDQRAETTRLWLAVTREARLARATERRRRKPPPLQALTSGHKQMMMRMLWIADSDLELAALCLDHARYPPPWTALSTLEKMELLNDVLLQVDAVDVEAWTDTSHAQHLAPMTHLWKLLTECSVAKWVIYINRSSGVSPSSRLVYDPWMRFAESQPPKYKIKSGAAPVLQRTETLGCALAEAMGGGHGHSPNG